MAVVSTKWVCDMKGPSRYYLLPCHSSLTPSYSFTTFHFLVCLPPFKMSPPNYIFALKSLSQGLLLWESKLSPYWIKSANQILSFGTFVIETMKVYMGWSLQESLDYDFLILVHFWRSALLLSPIIHFYICII